MSDAWVPAAAPPPPAPQSPGPGRGRGAWVAGAVVLVGGVLALALLTRGGGDGASSTTTTAPVDQARSLNDLVALGRETVAHVTYSVVDPSQTSGSTTVETWRVPPRYRYDQVVTSSTGARRDVQLDDGRELVRCVQLQPGGPTSCPDRAALTAPRTPQVAALVPPDLARTFVYSVTQAATPPTLEASDAEVAGRPARCFAADGVGELCLSPDGVVLRLVLGQLRVEVTALDDVVPPAVFDPR